MASILKVDELQGITAAGDITVTSEGGAATQSLQQGLAKAWLQLNGSTFGVTDSLNISGATDNGSGDYTASYVNSMNSAVYAIKNSTTIDIIYSIAIYFIGRCITNTQPR